MGNSREHKHIKTVSIIGGTFSGNKGAAGMLVSVIENLNQRMPGQLHFNVLSIYPKEDKLQKRPSNVNIISGTPFKLVILLPIITTFYALFKKLHLPTRLFLIDPLFKATVNAEILIDVAGISYVDGRGATLLYNFACNYPAIVVGTPIVKISQALGPFNSLPNKILSGYTLPRINKIFARGQETEKFLKTKGLSNFIAGADVAFILPDSQEALHNIRGEYPILSRDNVIIGVAPSQVVANYCRENQLDLVRILSRGLQQIQKKLNAHIIILAHSMRPENKPSKNNDYHICQRLYNAMDDKDNVTLILEDHTPSELREIIRTCDVFLSCRFHGMISSLCAKVPALVIGWSHKYFEVMKEFELEEDVITFENLTDNIIIDKSVELYHTKDVIYNKICDHLPAVQESARKNIDYITDLLLRSSVK